MGEFYVNTKSLANQSRSLSDVSDSIKTTKNTVANISSGMSGIGLGSITPSMAALEARLIRHMNKAGALSTNLAAISLKYVAVESEIMGIPITQNPNYNAVVSAVAETSAENAIRVRTESSVKSNISPYLNDSGIWEHDKYGEELNLGSSTELLKLECHDNDSEKNWVDQHRKEYNLDDDLTKEYKENYNARDISKNLSVEGKLSYSALSASGEYTGDYLSAKGEINVGNVETHGTLYAGIFNSEGKFAPGIGAEVGFSGSLLDMSGEVRTGNDYFGQYVKGEVEVGKVGATASATFGLVDKNGQFNPSCGVGAEAEAILAQASGSAGYRIMGTDVGVSGSIGVGAGAHANIGLQDGKVSVDVGAYLGVGGSVSFELDFNDTYDTMVSAWGDVKDFAGDVSDFAGDVWDGAKDTAADVWDTITFWD